MNASEKMSGVSKVASTAALLLDKGLVPLGVVYMQSNGCPGIACFTDLSNVERRREVANLLAKVAGDLLIGRGRHEVIDDPTDVLSGDN